MSSQTIMTTIAVVAIAIAVYMTVTAKPCSSAVKECSCGDAMHEEYTPKNTIDQGFDGDDSPFWKYTDLPDVPDATDEEIVLFGPQSYEEEAMIRENFIPPHVASSIKKWIAYSAGKLCPSFEGSRVQLAKDVFSRLVQSNVNLSAKNWRKNLMGNFKAVAGAIKKACNENTNLSKN